MFKLLSATTIASAILFVSGSESEPTPADDGYDYSVALEEHAEMRKYYTPSETYFISTVSVALKDYIGTGGFGATYTGHRTKRDTGERQRVAIKFVKSGAEGRLV